MAAFELALVAVFGFLILLRVAVVVAVVLTVVRPARSCPACFLPTIPLRTRWSALLPRRLEWRWCPDCGWEGPGRRIEERRSIRRAPRLFHEPPPPAPKDLGARRWEGGRE